MERVTEIDKKRIVIYLTAAFSITYIFWWGLALLTNCGVLDSSDFLYTLLHLIGGFGPTIAAVFVLPKKSPKEACRFLFSREKNTLWILLLFCAAETLIIGVSSLRLNPSLPWYIAPVVLLWSTVFSGGNEELGWRGVLQPELEKKFPFPIATLITGGVWMVWHIPLWFVTGTSQQGMSFLLFCVYGMLLSFWLASLRKRTNSVLYCAIFHGLSNLLLSLFVVQVNGVLIGGLCIALALSVWFYYQKPKASKTE